MDGLDDRVDRLEQRLANLVARDQDDLRNARDEVASLDLHLGALRLGRGGPDRHLHELGRALADQHVVLAFHVVDDRFVHLVATDADRARRHDAGERDHRDVRRATTDVNDHVPGRRRHVQPRTDRRRHRLLDQEHFPCTRGQRRLADGPLLDAGDARRHADHDPRPGQRAPIVGALDEVAKHRFGDLEVGDDAVLDRPDRFDVARRSA